MRGLTLLALLLLVILYLVMGALVFGTLEAPQESQAYQRLLQVRENFLRNHSHCVTEEDFKELIKGMVTAVEAGLDLSSSMLNFTSHWDIGSAFFFCGTIITTIGFGNLSPRTWFGQLFCVCYALVGIPMFGILLAGVGEHMGTMLRRAVAKIETLFLKRKVSPTIVRVSSAVLSILIGCLIFLFVPTLVFKEVEKWTFLEAIYFVVITLTTVGFGDFVPGMGRDDNVILKPLVWVWIVFGMAYFASILTMIANWLRVLSKRTRAEMEELRAHATDWTQNIQNMDFRIPNPLEFNDPFLLQRRRWKRSERRRVRRGAQGTLGYLVRGGSENGHLRNRWADLSGSILWLQTHSLGLGARDSQPRLKAPGLAMATVPRVGVAINTGARSYARSLSLPVARSALRLDFPGILHAVGDSGSESQCDSRSDAPSRSSSSSSSSLRGFQPCQALSRMEEARRSSSESQRVRDWHRPAERDTPMELHKLPVFVESGVRTQTASPVSTRHSSSAAPSPHGSPSPRATPPLRAPPLLADCQLLDFFGENLAYIDESSDTLSDRAQKETGGEEKRRRPRKPKRRSIRRQLPQGWSPLVVRKRLSSDIQPPSLPPTPPPPSSL